MRRIIFVVGVILCARTIAAQDYFIIKDLRPDWMVFKEGKYYNYSDKDKAQAIHIPIKPGLFKGDKLLLESNGRFSVWLNNQLLTDQVKRKLITMDSLSDGILWISLYQEEGLIVQNLRTQIITEVPSLTSSGSPLPRHVNDARNFVLVSGLLLIIFFVLILRLNPKLTFHYFSVSRLFSLRESEEDQMFSRIASSANILFYFFVSLLIGYMMMVMVIGLPPVYRFQFFLEAETFKELSVRWLQVSGIILAAFFVKSIAITLLSVLFDIRDQAGFQFLGFIRAGLLVATLLTVCTVFYFIISGSHMGWFSFLYESLRWLMIGWIMLIYFKLNRRVAFSSIHLFSYICATELIPFFVVFKILYE